MTCPDCRGTGTYTGLNHSEPCHCQLSADDSCGEDYDWNASPEGWGVPNDGTKYTCEATIPLKPGDFVIIDDPCTPEQQMAAYLNQKPATE
jgi:hypothetical protein